MDFGYSDTSIPSLTGLGDIPADFNLEFDAFIQDDDANYLAGESSESSNRFSDGPPPLLAKSTQLPTTTSASELLPSSSSAAPVSNLFSSPDTITNAQSMVRDGLRLAQPSASTSSAMSKHRMERKGHTKSRRGCFNCKRRRIKCQETRPACGHCIKTGLNCEYPAIPTVVHQPQHQIPIFSLQDMRLFQHFLLQCYPHYPIGAENIWSHEIPCLSQKYEYLMHAILGFSASELLPTDPSLISSAMEHRLKAIKAIKRTLLTSVQSSSSSSANSSFEEGNALMATCFALTFQSVALDDGMVEYMTFIRGIIIVAYQMYMKGAKFLFGDFLGERQNELLEPFMREVGLVRGEWVDGAVGGIRGLGGLLDLTMGEGGGEADGGDEAAHALRTERKYYSMILDMAEKLRVSSWEAYKALSAHYGWWMMLPHAQFERLIDPENQVAVLLATHWIALKQIMARITEQESKGAAKRPAGEGGSDGSQSGNGSGRHDMDVGIIRWLKFLNRSVKGEFVGYNSWPLWVEEQLDRDLGFFGKGSVRSGGGSG